MSQVGHAGDLHWAVAYLTGLEFTPPLEGPVIRVHIEYGDKYAAFALDPDGPEDWPVLRYIDKCFYALKIGGHEVLPLARALKEAVAQVRAEHQAAA